MQINIKSWRAVVALVVLAIIPLSLLLRPASIGRKEVEPALRRWLKSQYAHLSKDELNAIQLDPQGPAGQAYSHRMLNLDKIEFPVLETKRAWMKPRHSAAAVVAKVEISFAAGPPPDGKRSRYFLLTKKYWGDNWEVHREIGAGEFRWGIG